MTDDTKVWALASDGRVLSEDGGLIATFADAATAVQIVEDHNFEVQIEREDTDPEVIKSRAEKNAERIAAWKREDPDGVRPVKLLSDNLARMARLLSLRAPQIILAGQARRIAELGASLAELFPEPTDVEAPQ